MKFLLMLPLVIAGILVAMNIPELRRYVRLASM
jgi:hypothetical protein